MINPKDLLPKPSKEILVSCDELLEYPTTDTREVLKITVINIGIYAKCANKMNNAVLFIKSLTNDD